MRLIKFTIYTVLMFCLTIGFTFAGDQHEAEGVIKGIKKGTEKVTIAHGPIKSLGMDGMTMDFKVYDPAMLGDLKEGHKISMVLEQDKQGNFIIMEFEDQGMATGSMSGDGHGHNH